MNCELGVMSRIKEEEVLIEVKAVSAILIP